MDRSIEDSTAVKTHQPCKFCGGHDPATLYSDGHWYCFSCNKTWRDDTVSDSSIENNFERRLEKMEEGKIRDIADRCLTEETCRKFGVRSLVKDHRIQKHFYPYYNKAGEKVAEKTRIVDTKQFFWTGSQEDLQLFGAQCQPTTGRAVVLLEGCIDTMTMWQVLGGRCTCVGLPNGCKSFKAIKDNYEYLDKFDSIVLCMDGDKAGREATEKMVQYLPQKKLKIMRMPEDMKDPNEFLKAGKTQELVNLFWRAEPYTPKDIVNISQMYERVRDYRKSHQYIPTPWQGLNDVLQGTRPGQVVVLASGCVSADTEFFTGTTWKKISEYRVGDKVLQFNKDTHTAELVYPAAYIKAPCEWLYSFKSKYGIDMELSPEHTVLYAPNDSVDIKEISAEEYSKRFTKFKGRIPTSFTYGSDGIPLSDVEILLMLAVIADGSFRKPYNRSAYLHIKKERKKQELKRLLELWGHKYRWYDRKDGFTDISFRPPRIEKVFSSFWYGCSQRQLKLICDNILQWDGCVVDGKRSFSTSVKETADFVQFAFSSCGYRARISCRDRRGELRGKYIRTSFEYTVQITDRVYVGSRSSSEPTRVPTKDGYKYCFTVPSHALVLRHNGCIFCTGNSGQGKSLFLKTWMMHLVNTTDVHIGTLYLEETPEETVLSLMSQVAGKNLKKNYIYDACTPEELKEYFDRVGAGSRIDLFDPIGDTSPEYICNKIRYMAVIRDCKYVVLDHLTFVAEAEDDVKRSLDKLMNSLHKIAVELGLVILCACHLRKSANSAKSAEEGGRITLADLKDSSSIYQLSDVCLALERNSQDPDPDKANTTLIRVLKSRDFGEKGPATAVFYEKDTTRLVEIGLESLKDSEVDLE